jgi:FtsP/CotA-like multicopper oxidase with cupredoxin domain
VVPDASASEEEKELLSKRMALAWEIYYEAIAEGSAAAPVDGNCINAAVKVWPRIIPVQDAVQYRPEHTGNVDYYQIVMEEIPDVQILAGLGTTIWGYFDHPFSDLMCALAPGVEKESPGPTIVAQRGRAVIIRFVNRLKADSDMVRPGELPHTSIHGHGLHTPPQSDGYPTDCIPAWDGSNPPCSRVYVHPNDNDFPGTLWYHDHTNHHTGRNVYYGLAGFYILRPFSPEEGEEEKDKRDEFFRSIEACLPSGDCDVPMVLQDRLFNQDGSLNYPDFNHDGVLGDTFLVNGRVQPYLAVEPRRYRFRFLNGSNARFYSLAFSKNPSSARSALPFDQIGTEGALLPRPVTRTRTEIAMAERQEVVFDFGACQKLGITRVFLTNCLQQDDGRGPDEVDLDRCTPLVRFDIGDTVTGGEDTSSIPSVLNPELVRDANGEWAFPGYSAKEVARDRYGNPKERVFRFDRSHGMWTVNGEIFGAHRNDAVGGVLLSKYFKPPTEICMVANPVPAVPTGVMYPEPEPRILADVDVRPEIWRLVNDSGGWMHPIHIHLEQFKLLSREDSGGGQRKPAQPHEAGLKDTFILHENETARVITTFRDPNHHFDHTPGVLQDYVFHCHNIEHEDMDMMATNRMFTKAEGRPEPDPSGCDSDEEN